MGYKAIIYGRIEGLGEIFLPPDRDFAAGLYTANRSAIEDLPDTDADWPFLTRHMFSLAHPTASRQSDRGIYRGQIIHFGSALKVDPHDVAFAETWLAKLERQVLPALVWRTAVVHFEHEVAGVCVVRYEADMQAVRAVLEEFEWAGRSIEAQMRWTRSPEVAVFGR